MFNGNFIPVNEPLLDGNEKKYVLNCLETGWISSEGAYVRKFEEAFSSYVCRKHGIAVANGTAAIDIAIAAIDIQSGDEVIVPTFTIISCIQQILRIGAIPVFVDCCFDTFNMDPSQIESAISSKTKAILVPHIYGLPADLSPIIELADLYGLKIIEDAAQAIGQTYCTKPCGSFGSISTFSFYPNKHITTGEGGMIVTDDDILAEKCRSLRNLCFQENRRFFHDELGWNYRMTNIQAAVGLAQLESIERHLKMKRDIGNLYYRWLDHCEDVHLPLKKTEYADNLYWVFTIVLKGSPKQMAKDIMLALAQRGIGTRPFFYPLHLQPVCRTIGGKLASTLPNAEYLADYGFYLPSGFTLTEQQIEYICESLISILAKD